ncbi:hypothetical protein [Bilifractor sp. HCP3S3_D3]|uniref:hypothetical protein n=1 Tax=Bilifractor sp. HCP3S3_D3 TaxID=3438907 RepID=UPI003F89D876
MNKKIEYKGTDITQKLTVDTNELRGLLSCGRATAVKIGTEAGARIQFGHRVLWNTEKIRAYLNSISE